MDAQPPSTTSTPASTSAPQPPVTTSEDKTPAIVSYLTLIGFIVAIVLNSSKKTKLGAFHLRQMLGLILTQFASSFLLIIPLLGLLVWFAIFITMFVFWVMGLISALNGQMKPVPVLGAKYQEWFGTAFE